MSITNNPDRGLPEDIREPRSVDQPVTRERVQRERKVYRERERGREEKRSNTWKIVALAIGAYALYHFRYWMREKLHLAFSKVPQNEIEGNMGTTAAAGGPNRPLPGNGEGRGTNSGNGGIGSSGF